MLKALYNTLWGTLPNCLFGRNLHRSMNFRPPYFSKMLLEIAAFQDSPLLRSSANSLKIQAYFNYFAKTSVLGARRFHWSQSISYSFSEKTPTEDLHIRRFPTEHVDNRVGLLTG